MKLNRILLVGLLIAVFCVTTVSVSHAQAQTKRRVIQLSGIVLGEDSVSGLGLPGVHIYVPKAGRGTTTNHMGFFSMPVLVGDSVVISSIGYQRAYHIVKDGPDDYRTIVIELEQDNTYLKEVTILPFPTEEVFKQAVLALNVPMDESRIDPRNLNAELLALMMRTTPMDANLNHKYYMEQYNSSISDRSVVRTNPYLNPFNWARFFRDLKRK